MISPRVTSTYNQNIPAKVSKDQNLDMPSNQGKKSRCSC